MISVIIPTLNEAAHLPLLLDYLQHVPHQKLITEIIVSDGNSTDGTAGIATGFHVHSLCVEKAGRSHQMNEAAKIAQGKILYFLHADSFPPKDFAQAIVTQVENGYPAGCFRLKFDYPHWFLRFNAWFTRFNITWFRFGDQSLFITRALFFSIGQFRKDHCILEDQEIIQRINSTSRFVVIPKYIITSARKYRQVGVYKLQGIYLYLYTLYRVGVHQSVLLKKYHQLIHD